MIAQKIKSIEDDILEYRRQLMNSPVPKNLQSVIKQIIPPNGIRRKNFEGHEFIEACDADEEENADRATDDELRESESETSEDEESPSDQPSVVVPENKGSRGIASLQNVCNDPEINKDAVFLDEFRKVLEKNETSVLFKPHLNKMKATFFKARRNLEKRITAKIQSQQREGEQEQQRTDIMDEDDNNIFELLQNM